MPQLESDTFDELPPLEYIPNHINNISTIQSNLPTIEQELPRLRYFHNLLRMLENRTPPITPNYNNLFNVDNYESNTDLEERIGKVTIGIKNIDFICKDMILEKEEECIICREEFQINDTFKKLNCEHFFCTSCVQTWFKENTKCPVCQISYNNKDNKDNIIINY